MTTNNIKEEILGEFEKRYSDSEIYNKLYIDWFPDDVKQFILSSLDKYANAKLEEVWQQIKNYDFKEKHICGFNDGKQDCECFIGGLNVSLSIINNLKTK